MQENVSTLPLNSPTWRDAHPSRRRHLRLCRRVAFMAHKWGRWAATTRRSAVETLTDAVCGATLPGPPRLPNHRVCSTLATRGRARRPVR